MEMELIYSIACKKEILWGTKTAENAPLGARNWTGYLYLRDAVNLSPY